MSLLNNIHFRDQDYGMVAAYSEIFGGEDPEYPKAEPRAAEARTASPKHCMPQPVTIVYRRLTRELMSPEPFQPFQTTQEMFGIGSMSLWVIAPSGLMTLVVVRFCLIVVYRLFFHPLAKVPGPKFAAASWLYEIYFDFWLGGQFYSEIGRLHEIYGPIIRVTPDEVHVNDPELIDTVYPGGHKKTNKDPYLMSQFGFVKSTLTD